MIHVNVRGLLVREVENEKQLIIQLRKKKGEPGAIITNGDSFRMECIKPFCAYQTLEGPFDSFGIHFICEVEGKLLTVGDNTADIHWAGREEIQSLIDAHQFLEIDLPAVLMFLRDEY